MILLDDKVIELIKKPKNKEAIKEGTDLNKASQLHFTGEDYEEMIVQLVGFETANEYKNKRGLAEPVTMKQTSFIYTELTRWKNNNEIKVNIDFNKDYNAEKQYKKNLEVIWNGDTIENFRNNTLAKAVFTNFNDFILLEKPAKIKEDNDNVIVNGIVTPKSKTSKYYIVLIEIEDCIDFAKNGNNVEYLIYELDCKKIDGVEVKRYRCIDSTTDRIFIQKGDVVSLDISEKIFTHTEIPVKQIGSEPKEVGEYEVVVSPINSTIPLMDRYLKFDSINLVSETKGAYPKNWAFGAECPECGGDGKITNPTPGGADIKCPTCKGQKLVEPFGNGETLLIPPTYNEGQNAFNNTPAGTIQVDSSILTYQKDRLKERDEEIIKSALGSYMNIDQTGRTLGEAIIDIKPLEDRNALIASAVEYIENWICNYIGKQYSTDFKSYSLRIPRKLNILDEANLLLQIKQAKEQGLSISYIKELQKQLIYSVYRNDVQMLNRQLVLLELEPLTSFTMNDIKDLKFVAEIDKIIKQYFTDIITTLELQKGDIVKYYTSTTKDIVYNEIITLANNYVVKKETLLIDSLGIGGTQALQAVLSDSTMSEPTKRGVLQVVFGITPEKIDLMFPKITN